MGIVFVPTPLGNLRDVTLRAIDVLRDAPLIVAEDSRVTRRLLNALGIGSKEIWTYHEHNARATTAAILARAHEETVAVVSDAGTPGISDPGSALAAAARAGGVAVEVLPGPAAFVCAAVLSGFDLRRFVFAGFPPRGGGQRRSAFRAALGETTIWYEAPHRIRESLADLAAVAPERRVFLVRELSKLYEQQVLGTPAEVAAALAEPVRGEMVFVVEGGAADAASDGPISETDLDAAIDGLLADGLTTSAIAKQLADAGHGARRHLYTRVSDRRQAARNRDDERQRVPAPRSFYVTTPIYYISGTPHIGHAYTSIAADVLVRTARAHGPARSLTGTDEHGQKVANAAAAAGMTPQAYVDALAPKWRDLAPAFDAHFDDFIRTTEPRHAKACLALFERMRASGDVYEGVYEGWYCTHDETFWPEAKLVDGRCPNDECRRPVQWLSEKNWFFRLSRYHAPLLELFRGNPEFLRPQTRYNEMMAILEEGLEDFSISRSSFDWGIPLPGGGVLYVWYDALINYISALGWPDDADRLYARFWPGMHLIGKEIARFHTIIWPAMLMSAGLPIPRRIFAHGWITSDTGTKIGKSLGNAMDPFAIKDEFGADTLRYFLLREAPFGSDFSISIEKLRQRHNSDLGNDLGNLLRRSLAMLEKYRNGLVPEPHEGRVQERVADLPALVNEHVTCLRFREALDEIWNLVTLLNRAIDEQKPWELYKHGRGVELDALLYDLCEGLRWLSLLLFPFMPAKMTEIWQQLGLAGTPEQMWDDELVWGRLGAGTQTNPGAPLFPRIEPRTEVPA